MRGGGFSHGYGVESPELLVLIACRPGKHSQRRGGGFARLGCPSVHAYLGRMSRGETGLHGCEVENP